MISSSSNGKSPETTNTNPSIFCNRKFNNDFKCENYFPIVEPLIPKEISRVMSLRDGMKKMSKSEDSDQSRINLKDDKDLIDQK